MKGRYGRFILFLILCFAWPAPGLCADQATTYAEGRLEYVEGVRVVRLSGSPRDIGLQHGNLLRAEIHALMNYFFMEKSTLFGAGPDVIAKAAKTLEKHIPAEYLEEMKAVAEGAGVPFERLFAANVFLDVVSAGWVGVKPGCSNFAAFGKASKDGRIVHGRNLDWSAESQLAAANTVFFITPKDGVPFVSLSWPGMVGTLTGLNAKQISMGEMTSVSTGATLDGTPFMIHLRKLLQYSKTLDDAYRILEDTPRTTGYNVLVTDGKTGDGFIAEINAKRVVRIAPENGILVHTNHYTNAKMAATQKKLFYMVYGTKKTNTNYRYERLNALMAGAAGGIDAQAAMGFLSDKFDPLQKKISGDLENTVCTDDTLQSVVMLPQTGDLYVALKTLPAPDGGYVHLQLPLDK